MRNILIISVLLFTPLHNLFSQSKVITGRVIDDNLVTLPSVSILIKDTVEVARTDFEGYFQVEIPVYEKKLSFEMVGLDRTSIELVNNCEVVEVVMMLSSTFDFISFRRAERKRRKRFNELPKIYEQAFEKSIFTNKYPCYIREFEPFYLNEN
ncbi:MAG: carboxypeptidase-like regulatory domain-containing protein [Flavobacteriaceae bacterium]|nr:carboxypeptidase-like regulatory domain-containing protein [Flavobacteriaceae bacterium]